ncbi:ATP-dependent helicase, partial [Patescibacteria group bacterium]|nr:ATP-dependent helicase [Patescibacteria group bacterium]
CNYLSRHELPYQFLALKGLYTRPVVIDILSFFKLLDNYHESPALFRVMSLSIYNIAEDQLIELNMEARQASSSLWQVSTRASSVKSLQPETVKSLENVVALVERASKMARAKNVGQVFKYFLEQSGYLHWLDHLPEFEKNQKLSWLEQFWRRIKKFETDHEESRLSDFMNEIDFELEAGEEGALKFEPEEGPEMIQILTIHGAKGLEFKHVFAVNMVDRRFPTIERKEAIPIPDALVKEILTQGDAHLEEERRLFYVAMTRAKHNLYFTSADDYGGLREKKLSRFLIELGYTKEKDATRPTGAKLPIFEESVKADKPAKIKYKLPAKFSFTRLVAFRTCPLQYKYAHILKIPVFGSGNMSFGRSMHNTLERFFREWLTRRESEQAQLFGDKGNKETDESKPGLEELISIYDQEWISSWYEDENEMRKRKESGKKALTRYWEVLSRDWPNALVVEQAFNLKLGDYILKGRIDRVDQLPNGNLAIVDYKTGKARRELASEDKEQLLIYQMALEDPKLFGKKVEKLVYYYLEEGCDVEFVGKEKDMDKLKESVIRRIEQIKESEFAPKPSELCKHCDFASICDYRKL